MKLKTLSKRTRLLAVAVLLLMLFGTLLYCLHTSARKSESASSYAKPQVKAVTTAQIAPTTPGLPIQLQIPAIGVDAPIDYVGLSSSGLMDKPKNQNTVAWYQPGKRPGEIGSAVMAGHYGTWANGRGSVFDSLNKLQKGDKVSVLDDKGATITFVVQGSRDFGSAADATDVFRSSDGKSHLNLITCEGIWNKDSQSYPSRLVIFTDKE